MDQQKDAQATPIDAKGIKFRCLDCSRALKLQPLPEVNEEARSLTKSDDSVDMYRKMMIPMSFPEIGDDFMVVEELAEYEKVRVTEALLEMVSNDLDVEHSLCDVCADNLLDLMDHQLKINQKECKQYLDFIGHIELEDADLDQLQVELETLQAEEKKLQAELKGAEIQYKDVDKVLQKYTEQNNVIRKTKQGYYHDYLRLKRQLLTLEDQQVSVGNELDYAEGHLRKLRSVNIFDTCFDITDIGQCGSINSFRFGRLPDVYVEWHEINAAWGQVALLMRCVAKKINLTFKGYHLVPCASHSYLQSLDEEDKKLPLYFSGKEKFICDPKFDSAMVAFLECVQQLQEKIEETAKFHLPHPVEKGRISEGKTGKTFSIRVQFNSEENWTKALKLLLTNFKWALALISERFPDK